MQKWMLVCCLLVFYSCNKEKHFDGPNNYSDSFDDYHALEDLLLPSDVRWSFTQITREGNLVSPDSIFSRSGKSLRFEAIKSEEDLLSKCSIAKQKMAFWEGEVVYVSAWYYLSGDQPLNWCFLMDLEERTPIGSGPGMRLALVNNQIRIEYKFNEDDLLQKEEVATDFPRNEWVHLEWEVELSQKEEGSTRFWQNGELLIEAFGVRTLPDDVLYFQQGTKGMYTSIEIGLTANSDDNDALLWVDDFLIEKR